MVDNIIKEFLAEKEQEKKNKSMLFNITTPTYEYWSTGTSTLITGAGITNPNLGYYYTIPVILGQEHGFTYDTVPQPTTTVTFNNEND